MFFNLWIDDMIVVPNTKRKAGIKMKQIIFTSLLFSFLSMVGFGQAPTRVERVGETHIMKDSDFENLQMPASMFRLGKISEKEKKFSLDRFTSILSAENKTVEYVFLLNGLTAKEVGGNMGFIYQYLTEDKKVKPSRISFALTAKAENEMEFWLIPNSKLTVPGCPDCVIIAGENSDKLKEFFKLKTQ